ncbi:MAG: protein phosphatase CheZ [Gammaproteobacteria bacterium]|nr:protein phosphatase CheZ [Gammaproteobacteria bacterium]
MADDKTINKDDLLGHAHALIAQLEGGNENEINRTLDEIMRLRESSLFQELGKLTREFHDTLNSFRFDERMADLASHEIPDAKERLNYVITMTDQAAHRTLSAVEETIPLSEQLEQQAAVLTKKWERLLRRELSAGEFKELSQEVGKFLPLVLSCSSTIHSNLSDVLLAQDYQDITGQIIRRVIKLVQDVEDSLVRLIKISGQHMMPAGDRQHKAGLDGPQVNAEHPDVVVGQDNVDDLLSSLGF